jgi:hypothetical protein
MRGMETGNVRRIMPTAPAPTAAAAATTPSVAAAATATPSAAAAAPSSSAPAASLGERQVRCAERCPKNHSEDAETDGDSQDSNVSDDRSHGRVLPLANYPPCDTANANLPGRVPPPPRL